MGPLAILSTEDNVNSRLMVVSLFITLFAFLMPFILKASDSETLGATAVCAAIIAVLVRRRTVKMDLQNL